MKFQSAHIKWYARLILLLGVSACMFWLTRLDHRSSISTDVLDLIPADERDPELALVRSLAGERQGRVALFSLGWTTDKANSTGPVPAAAQDAFSGYLMESGAFREVHNLGDPSFRESFGRFIFDRRFDLLLPGWLADKRRQFVEEGGAKAWSPWLASRVCNDLDTFLAGPDSLVFEQILPADPLLLVPQLVQGLQGIDGLDAADDPDGPARIWAETLAPPLREDGQGPVFAAVEEALAHARSIEPGLDLKWTAVSRFAAESRRRIEAEFKGLNSFALLAVVLVLSLALRRAWQVMHLVPVMLCSLLGAWTVTTMVFPRAHMLVFVLGSLLAGVAVDYGLHVFLHRGRAGETFLERARSLWRPLLASTVTTLAGFALLISSDLPLLRQTGVFICAGIATAAATALLWFAQSKTHEGKTRLDVVDPDLGSGPVGRRVILGVLLIVAAVSVLGPWRLQWHDDIRELEIRSPELWENDRAVRDRFGGGEARELFLSRGDNVAQARAALGDLREWLRQTAPQARLASLGLALPLEIDHIAAAEIVRELASFETDLRSALESSGYDAGAFEPFFAAWRTLRTREAWPAYGSIVRDFAAGLRGPLGMAMSASPGASWFAAVIDDGPGVAPPTELNTVSAGQLETLNHLFGRTRQAALWLSLIGLSLVTVCVVAIYGPRRGVRMAAVPVGASLFVFGVYGIAGQTLNLFHLLGAFLAVGMTIDYAIFAGDSARRGHDLPPSVRLSALTTVASFGVLGFSAIPVVSALGITVALIITTGWGLVELLARIERGQTAIRER